MNPFRALAGSGVRAEMCRSRRTQMPQHERANPLCACGCVPAGLSLIEAAKARRQRRRDAARRRLGAACAADDAREVLLAIDGGAHVAAACFGVGGEVIDAPTEGLTATYVAAYSGAAGAMRCLLDECAADPNAGGECGSTPLHGAGASGAADCIRLCAARDLSPSLPGVCVLCGPCCARRLLRHGADPSRRDAHGATPADAAREHPLCVRLLRDAERGMAA